MNYPQNYVVPQNGYGGIPDPRLPPAQRQVPVDTDETPEPEDFNAAHKGAAWTGSIVSIIALILAVVAILLVLLLNPPSAVGRWYSTTISTGSLGTDGVGGNTIGIKNRYAYVVSPDAGTRNTIRFSGGSVGDVFGVANTSTVNTLVIYNGNTRLGTLLPNSGSVLYVYRTGSVAPVRSIDSEGVF